MAAFVYDDVTSGTGDGNLNDGANWYVGGVQQNATPTSSDTASISSSGVSSTISNGTCAAPTTLISSGSIVLSNCTFSSTLNSTGTIQMDGVTVSGAANIGGPSSIGVSSGCTFQSTLIMSGNFSGGTVTGDATINGQIDGGIFSSNLIQNGGSFGSNGYFVSVGGNITSTGVTFQYVNPGSGLLTSTNCGFQTTVSRTINDSGSTFFDNFSASATVTTTGGAIESSGGTPASFTTLNQTGGVFSAGTVSTAATMDTVSISSAYSNTSFSGTLSFTNCSISGGSFSGGNYINCTINGPNVGNANLEGAINATNFTFSSLTFSNVTEVDALELGGVNITASWPSAGDVRKNTSTGHFGGSPISTGTLVSGGTSAYCG